MSQSIKGVIRRRPQRDETGTAEGVESAKPTPESDTAPAAPADAAAGPGSTDAPADASAPQAAGTGSPDRAPDASPAASGLPAGDAAAPNATAAPAGDAAASKDGHSAPSPDAPARRAAEPSRAARSAGAGADGRTQVRRDLPSRPAPRASSAPSQAPPEAGPMPTTDDFEAMLAGADLSVPVWESGQRVKAEVVSISAGSVFVSLGGKSEGRLDRAELEDDEGALTVSVGDRVEATVIGTRGGTIELAISLGRQHQDTSMLAEAAAQEIPVQGRVAAVNKGGFEVELGGVRAFCPVSQIELGYTEDTDGHVGATYDFLITRYEEGGRNIVVSRAALQRREREAKAEETLRRLEKGAILDGVVSRIEAFGAFVDLGGVDGLVHVSELSWARLEHPSEAVHVGDRIRVKVLRVEGEGREMRIALSVRELEDDPWDTALRSLHAGDTINGTVSRLEAFGAFVELRPGVDGLVHISELAHGKRINHPREVVKTGERIQVQVIQVDPRKRQIALSVKALMQDPWSEAVAKFRPGMSVQGTVASVQSFGVFVDLEGGITALLPMSGLPEEEATRVRRVFQPGEVVEARVLAVDAERKRLALTRRTDDDAQAQEAFAEWKEEQSPEQAGGLGTLADLLKARKAKG